MRERHRMMQASADYLDGLRACARVIRFKLIPQLGNY